MTKPEETRLAVPESSRTPDAYEKKYMAGEGLVLHRAKERAPWQWNAMMGATALAVIAPVFFNPAAWLGAAIGLPMMAIAFVLFSVLRVTVSEGHVNIQYGLFGPKIPIEAITHAEATTYDWKKFGGWGIKRSFDGEWIYNMPGDGGRAVRIEWTKNGRKRVTLVGSKEPQALAAAIEEARGRKALPATAS